MKQLMIDQERGRVVRVVFIKLGPMLRSQPDLPEPLGGGDFETCFQLCKSHSPRGCFPLQSITGSISTLGVGSAGPLPCEGWLIFPQSKSAQG